MKDERKKEEIEFRESKIRDFGGAPRRSQEENSRTGI